LLSLKGFAGEVAVEVEQSRADQFVGSAKWEKRDR